MRIEAYPWSKEEARAELARIRHPVAIAIERAKNPFNIGAIIRTAHSFLVQEIILIGSERWYERAAMGMQRFEQIVELPDEAAFLAHVAQRGYRLVALEREAASASLWSTQFAPQDCLLFGNENDGISPGLRRASTQSVCIPMFGINHSFPVSIAAGIAMHEWCRQHYAEPRLSPGHPPLRPLGA